MEYENDNASEDYVEMLSSNPPLDVTQTTEPTFSSTTFSISNPPPNLNVPQKPTTSPANNHNVDDYDTLFPEPTQSQSSIQSHNQPLTPFGYKQLISRMFANVKELAEAEKYLRRRDDVLFNMINQVQ